MASERSTFNSRLSTSAASAPGQAKDAQDDGVSRRDFLRAGSLSVVGLSVAERTALSEAKDSADRRSCILLLMTGGASQFETFDPKPDAPLGIRGPLRAIPTAVSGIWLSESLLRLAERADSFAILRSLCHDAAPIHETGQQLLQTGRLVRADLRHPSFGSVVASRLGPRGKVPPYVVLPRLVAGTGVSAYRGQQAGFLGAEFDPLTLADGGEPVPASPDGENELLARISIDDEPEPVRRAYGDTRFGKLCLKARQLVECGVRVVTVNLFDSLVGQVTWDCHGRSPSAPSTLYDYRDELCPKFDSALSALLDDLKQRGMLDDTLVIATGEFGRTPQVNQNGGRDHWPGVWSALVAGGGVRGGQVIGASDSQGAAPAERPIAPAELVATVYRTFGLDLDAKLTLDDQREMVLVDAKPIEELFA